MDPLQFKPQAHFIICCRSKENKKCCSLKSADELVDQLKSWVKKENLKNKIKISKSSCLGFCESGITACLYPQNQWFHNVKLEDMENLKDMLKKCALQSSLPESNLQK